jgi:antirestriction protein ArdC
MGAAFLSTLSGIESTEDNTAAYLNGWLSALKSDSKMIITAAAQAQRAVEWSSRFDWTVIPVLSGQGFRF